MEELKCCHRCRLRLTGERDATAYHVNPAVAAGEVADALSSDAVCPICLGLLQTHLTAAAVRKIADAVRAPGYAMRSFSLAIALPVALLVRERGAWLHLRRAEAAAAAATDAAASELRPLAAAANVVDLKDALRWALGDALSRELGVPYEPGAALEVQLGATHSATGGEHLVLKPLLDAQQPAASRGRKRGGGGRDYDGPTWQTAPESDSTRSVLRALGTWSADDLVGKCAGLCPPAAVERPCALSVVVERAPLCSEGRYRKLSRQLPQSPWVLDGERKCPSSVHEQLERHALDAFGAAATRFHAAGREDVDVRMLGGGRPFVLELLEAKAAEQPMAEALAALAARINGGGGPVEVEELRVCDSSVIGGLLKEGEESHRKHYRCVVRLSRRVGAADVATLAGAGELRLQQKTPLRVLHRRTQAVRERAVYAMEAKILGPRFLLLDLTTQAGTYVKEFVHGDLGRTTPNVGALLGCEADILQLDVVGLQG